MLPSAYLKAPPKKLGLRRNNQKSASFLLGRMTTLLRLTGLHKSPVGRPHLQIYNR